MRIILSLCMYIVAGILSAAVVHADDSYELLRQRYLSLRNTDINIVRRNEWSEVADKLAAHSSAKVPPQEAAAALFQSAMLREAMGVRFDDRAELRRSMELLERLVSHFPESENADDALVRLGDIALFEMKERTFAEKQYRAVIRSYPGSDMAEVAHARLKDFSSSRAPAPLPTHSEGAVDGPLIVIDPGHGGEDTGAVGIGGLVEKDVALDIALRVETLLLAQKTTRVRLTRRTDRFVPLAERTNFANDFDADLFLSLHTNASPKGKASGIETYYLDTTDDAASKKLAERENSSLKFEEGGAGDLQFMVSDLIQNAKLDESIVLAHSIHRSLLKTVKPSWKAVRDLGVKKGPFYVLVGAHMPCVLIELFFIDNKEDGKRLTEKKFRESLAKGIFQGIQQFLANQGKKQAHERR